VEHFKDMRNAYALLVGNSSRRMLFRKPRWEENMKMIRVMRRDVGCGGSGYGPVTCVSDIVVNLWVPYGKNFP
jgi:hypothetical protein